ERLWHTARHIGRGHGLGDLGAAPGVEAAVDLDTDASDPQLLFGLLELLRAAPHPDYRRLALRLGDNILATRFFDGFFLPSSAHVNATFDALEPLALLTLEAHLRGTPEAAPVWPAGRGYIHGPHDGMGRTTDSSAIWSKTRR
ncbi:MAG TPA: pectate lyase, partial [Candidatus Hydrogenedentes bacterium]|nr:pectate lyase [Candidatus Hydrogenedentota bacterium]